ncbi:phage minor head protein [Phocaeicola plebeius]|uniref:phage head morphogenesis protein n=1 Tax=Phocaeicola plebeius TaxID=310297 RepID=UPI0026EA9F00|nr:phage minor head protein [Phocaeicola plebeius]
MSFDNNAIRKKAKEWASVIKDPETRDVAEEAAEILLRQGFELPRIQEKDLGGKTKRGLVFANYNAFGKVINVNNNKAIRKAGGFRGYQQQGVKWGWLVQDNAILHELAHHIDSVINPDYDKVEHEWNVELDRQLVKKELSEYAATNRAEYEAELISGILRGKVYSKEILDYSYFAHLDDERAKNILKLGNGTIVNDSGLPREFDKMTETVYKNPEKDAAVLLTDSDVRKFIERQKLIFDNAVDTALKEVPLDDISVQRLKESNYVFSGIKTFHELNEAFPSLLDEEGNRKPFNQFLNDVQKVYDAYNVQYLRTEYNFAQASALMAARWKQFEQDGDRYNLQYQTMYDKRVRRTHRMLHNITLPIESPFWDKYFPPNGWNCRCTVVQVRKDKYPVSDEQEAMNLGSQATAGKYQEMFMFNPGKRMTTFPAYNGYTLRKCNRCEVRPDKMKLAADIPDNEVCRACRLLQESRLAGIHSATEGIRSIIRRLENGYPKGDAVRIGRLADDVKEFVRKKGIEPSTDEIYMTDKQIHHALRSVKQKAGKAVTAEQLAALPSLMDDSEVYWDEKAGNIQFITRQDGKIQKFVVRLNYAAKIQGEKKTVNAFITAGTIEERNLGMKNLVKIK